MKILHSIKNAQVFHQLDDFKHNYFNINNIDKYLVPISFILLIVLSYSLGRSLTTRNYNVLILLCGPLLFLVFINEGIKLLSAIFILICYLNYFIYVFGLPEFLTWYIEIYAIALLIKSVYVFTYEKNIVFKPYVMFIFFALIVHFVSYLLNDISASQLLISLRRYFVYYALFLAIVIIPSQRELYEKLIRIFVFTAIIQIPISIIQYFIFVRADYMGGLFGKNSSGTISTLGIAFAFLGYYLYKHYKRKLIFLFGGLGMIIPLVIAESKIGMLFLPLAYIYHLVLIEKKYLFRGIILLVCAMPLYVGTMHLFDTLHNREYMQESIRDPLYMLKLATREFSSIEYRINETGDGQLVVFNRIESIAVAFNLIKDSPKKLLFGNGPGEGSGSIYTSGSFMRFGFFPTFLVIGLIEIGLVGMAVWFIIFVYLYVINLKSLRYFIKVKSKSIWKAFIFFSNILMLVFLLEFIYSRSILLPYKGFFFWLINGLVVMYYYKYINNRRSVLPVSNESQEN